MYYKDKITAITEPSGSLDAENVCGLADKLGSGASDF